MSPAYAAVIAAAVTAPALACEPPAYDPAWRDTRIAVGADCSFTGAEAFPGQTISASRAQDVGNGRIGQVVTTTQACGIYQSLLVTDCGSGEAILIDAPEGNPPHSLGGAPDREIKDLYAPRGKLRLTAGSDIAQLAGQARTYGYRHTTDVASRINQMKNKNRYNPFCGCAVLYPDSAGAAKAGRVAKKG